MKVWELIEHLQRLPPDDDVRLRVLNPEAVMPRDKWETVELEPPFRDNSAVGSELRTSAPVRRHWE